VNKTPSKTLTDQLRSLVVEKVGVDGNVEARIVQLDREVVAALGRALGPGGPDCESDNLGLQSLGFFAALPSNMRSALRLTALNLSVPWSSMGGQKKRAEGIRKG
jgi:hypothetical protein